MSSDEGAPDRVTPEVAITPDGEAEPWDDAGETGSGASTLLSVQFMKKHYLGLLVLVAGWFAL